MKIQLKDDETYEIKLPEELTSQDFLILLEKLEKIVKLIKLSGDFKNSTYKDNPTRTRVSSIAYNCPNPFDTREKVLDFLQYGYHGTKEDKDRIVKYIGRSWKELQKRFHDLINRYSIQPNEIGLTKWKVKGENMRSDNRIPNWSIKSYTGVFDENGTNN